MYEIWHEELKVKVAEERSYALAFQYARYLTVKYGVSYSIRFYGPGDEQ